MEDSLSTLCLSLKQLRLIVNEPLRSNCSEVGMFILENAFENVAHITPYYTGLNVLDLPEAMMPNLDSDVRRHVITWTNYAPYTMVMVQCRWFG